jgi:hypothetical protein
MKNKNKDYLNGSAIIDAKMGIIYASIQKTLNEGKSLKEFIKSFIEDRSDNLWYFHNIYCLHLIVSELYPDHKEDMESLMLLI